MVTGRAYERLLLKCHYPVTREHTIQEFCFRWMNIQCVIAVPNSLSRFLSKTLISPPPCLPFMECWRLASFGTHPCLPT